MINIEQFGDRGIIIFGRDKNGKRYTKRDNDFYPYFYDSAKKKIVTGAVKNVSNLREAYPYTFEADIPYSQRYLIDKYEVPLKEEPLRICYIDIEVGEATLDTENTPAPITCLTCYDNFLDKFVTFVWRKDLKKEVWQGEKTYYEKYKVNQSIYYFNNEREMMGNFISFIQDTDPDILTGYNFDRYDLPYIINRCHKIRVDINKISPLNYISIKTPDNKGKRGWKRTFISIKGRAIVDVFKGYRGVVLHELPSYSLKYVANEELGLAKGSPDLMTMWEDIKVLVEYNTMDVLLTKLIDEKRMVIKFYDTLRRITGCTWNYTQFMGQMVDVCLLRESKKRNTVLPTKQKRKKGERIGGGKVLQTVPGVHTGVFVVDVKGTYPAIIRQFNISYETLDDEGDVKLGNGITFTSTPEGLIPSILSRLIDNRNNVKKEMRKFSYGSDEYNAYYSIQFALKFLINATYGTTANEGFRLFNPKLGGSITWVGRELVKWTKKQIEKLGYKVIYGDTDSIFVGTKIEDPDKIYELQVDVVKKLNDSYDDFVRQFMDDDNHHISIGYEKIFSKILFTKAKKRYAGRLAYVEDEKTNRLLIVGFEHKRSDFNIFGKEMQQKTFELVLDGATKKDIDEFVEQKKEEMKKVTDLNLIAIPKGMKKNPYEYERKNVYIYGAIYANKYLDEHFSAGDKLKFLYIKEVKGKPPTNVVCFKEKQPDVLVNWDKMIRLTIDNKVQKIYEAMEWSYILDGKIPVKMRNFGDFR